MKIIALAATLLFTLGLNAQVSVSTTGTTPDPSAMLDVVSTDKGMLIPRMTTDQRTAIATPANGLMVYDTDTDDFWFFNGSIWEEIGADNLGNHMATQSLDLSSNDIINAQVVFAEAFVGDGGNLTNVPGDNLGNHTATQIFNLAGQNVINGGIVTALAFIGDGSGLTNLPGDDLGDHTATQSINLNGNYLSGDGDGEGVYVDGNGAVGIGTGSPQASLHVVGQGDGTSVLLLGTERSWTFQQEGAGSGSSLRLRNTFGPDKAFHIDTDGRTNFRERNGSTTAVTIDHGNGFLGIGTTTPSSPLHVQKPVNNGYMVTLDNTAGQVANVLKINSGSTGTADIVDVQNGAFVVEANGNVGLGTTTPTSRLDVGGGNISMHGGWISNDGDDEAIHIRNDGHVGIGTTASGGPQLFVEAGDVSTTYAAFISATSAEMVGALRVQGPSSLEVLQVFDSDFNDLLIVEGDAKVGVGRNPSTNSLEVEGNASKSTAGTWLANSDRRIKQDIRSIDHALETLGRVRLVSFAYTDEYIAKHAGIGHGRYLNVIAQEFAEVFPDHVKGSGEYLPDGSEILQVDTYPLTIYSAAAIQELQQVIEQQQKHIEELQSENVLIKQQIEELNQLKAMVKQLQSSIYEDQLEVNNN